ncbi:chaps-domain-containing protein [Aulographum hederae CBS 113979]|uniref:Chaps-domain-containing protein n=1 Tax=Aulographum hederae CBS 113979 TaxID=1176131 RepID=A0A6G1GMT9_9PEZI|nr:chaps-domain-containing protein [Aulographum hederae CBS 113979]
MVVTPAVPEIFEDEILSSVEARSETLAALRELGPPDLVHLVKQPVKTSSTNKQIGVYHHVTGIDASSSASLAAYINTLTYNPSDKTQKVVQGLYCCYNAFSRLDMRVQVQIPGTVESYCIDERGDKRVATEDLWLETYLCSVLRAYSYADDGTGDTIKKIVGVRRFNPITSTEAEHKFLDAAERLFFNGWQLGSDPEIQVPNLVSNHLTTGLLQYIHTTGRYASGINLFEKLRTRDPEISSLLARVYIQADEEVKAVQLLHEAIQDLPMDYSLLDCQADFCNKKKRGDLALEIAKRSVVSAPSEFGTWARLAEVYVSLEQWDLALLTLNSCPMFTYQDKDAPRMPEPARIHLPVMIETVCDEIDDGAAHDAEQVHPQLRKLHAAGFKGTFLKAYMLLTEITSKIGWDQLLRIRSQVFVMEEEYRHEKQTLHQSSGTPHSRNASTTAFRGTPSPHANGHGESEEPEGESALESGDEETLAEQSTTNTSTTGKPELLPSDANKPIAHSPGLEKPDPTIASSVVHAGSDDPAPHKPLPDDPTAEDPEAEDEQPPNQLQFRHKRLCERWLDNLFMVLYEDLRVYTIWRTEMAQYRAQQLLYKKSAEEWEILGELAERLHHRDEAVEAWQACLSMRFSPKALRGVLGLWEREGDVRGILGAVIRLVTWQYRWYSEFSPALLYTVRRLIEEEGAVKVRSIIQGTSLPQNVLDLTHQYTQLCTAFRSSGSDG